MALPTSGPLSFTMIANELGVFTPFSLRNMSSNAGFGTPDAVSDFYGYGPTCQPYGTFLYSSCEGCAEIYHYADGSCGEYSEVVDYNSPNCGCGSKLTLFFRSNESNGASKTCGEECCIPAWHTGSNPLPIFGDTVYNDAEGTDPLEPSVGGFYGMSNKECSPADNWFYIDKEDPGKVANWGNCLLQENP